MLSTCLRVAVVAAVAFTASAPASAAVRTWSLATDFAVAPNQAKPNPDGYGNPSVWSVRQSATLAHTPVGYTLLPNFVENTSGIAGLESWQGTDGEPPIKLPSVVFNSTAADVFPIGIFMPAHSVVVHPFNTRVAVVAWQSPDAGTVSVSGGVVDWDAVCEDGIGWSVDKAVKDRRIP